MNDPTVTLDELRWLREVCGVSTQKIAATGGAAVRSVEGWFHGRAVPRPSSMLLRPLIKRYRRQYPTS